jgi:hypothetical protein
LSISFLALLLCAKRDSISTALQILESQGLLTYQTKKHQKEGLKVSLRPLTVEEMYHFQDNFGEYETEQIGLMEDEPQADPLVALQEEVERILEGGGPIDRLVKIISATPVWARSQPTVLRFCRRCPAGDEGFQRLTETVKMAWQIGL